MSVIIYHRIYILHISREKFFFFLYYAYIVRSHPDVTCTPTYFSVFRSRRFFSSSSFLEARYLHLSTYPTGSERIPLLAANAVREDFLKETSNLYHLTMSPFLFFFFLSSFFLANGLRKSFHEKCE